MNKRFQLRAKELDSKLEVKSRRRKNSSTYMEKNKIRIHRSKNYRINNRQISTQDVRYGIDQSVAHFSSGKVQSTQWALLLVRLWGE